MNIQYFMNDTPVKVDWQLNEASNELQLILNDNAEPLIIKLNKNNLNGGQIIAKYKERVVGSGKQYEIGILKKKVLASVYKIKYKFMEVK